MWLATFSDRAAETDRLQDNPNHTALLAAGLLGEAGGILAELKKEARERNAYPASRRRMVEEFGDFLWYYVRLLAVLDRGLLADLDPIAAAPPPGPRARSVGAFLELGAAVGELLAAVDRAASGATDAALRRVWSAVAEAAREAEVSLELAAEENIEKVRSRWPLQRSYAPLLDDGFPEEEQLPRKLRIEFRERAQGGQKVVMLRCNGLNFGDRVTDNIEDPDYYRYHDIFHFAYAAHLGWSPVIRALLRCKRKSRPDLDEAQDGARAAILEEAVSAVVFSRAKQQGLFDGVDQVAYDLLKTVHQFVEGYEVAPVPLWQWEVAILDGYRIFRLLRTHRGGEIVLDLPARSLSYLAPR